MPLILVLRSQRQPHLCELEVSQGYKVRLCLKKKFKKIMDNNNDDVKLTFGKSLENLLCAKDCISFQRKQPPASRLKVFPAAQGGQKAEWPIITGVTKQEWPICGGEDSRLLLSIPSDTQLESCAATQVL